MLLLSEIRDFLSSIFEPAEFYYVGKLNNKKEKAIGVYQLNTQGRIMPVSKAKGYDIKNVSLLIHWTNNSKDTEKSAFDLYSLLEQNEKTRIGNKEILIQPLTNEPVDVGSDENGIYERVIELSFYYKENNTKERSDD